MNRCFVFVVCGAREHIATLNFSLAYLRHYSKSEILVVTDLKRNEAIIEHPRVIDVACPASYTNHQASIWLKTSLHRILPKGPLYCYLDSDVIALSSDCDTIFDLYCSPVTFAADHCRLPQFSPYALHCGCSEAYEKEKKELETAISSVVNHSAYPPAGNDQRIEELYQLMARIQHSPLMHAGLLFKIGCSALGGKFMLNHTIGIDYRKKVWHLRNETFPILFAYRQMIKVKTGYSFSFRQRTWLKPDGSPPAKNHCNHLVHAIHEKFNVSVVNTNWQHWNGGVFLFNDESHTFFNTWHELTLEVFEDKNWKTRDQGSLVACVWKMKLENHPVLPERFNCIADYYNRLMTSTIENHQLIVHKGKTEIRPALIHVYHEYGNTGWDLWQHILEFKPPC